MITDAIESVLAQNYPFVEHIIIDGGSTDGTLDILKKYPHLRVISEPDDGIYDALNKGIHLAKGEIIGQLNTDDLYEKNVFAGVADAFQSYPDMDAVLGQAVLSCTKENGQNDIINFSNIEKKNFFKDVVVNGPIINAWFFRKNIFERTGGYNTIYKVASDRDFMIRLNILGFNYLTLDLLVYRYRAHGGSLTFSKRRSNRQVNENLTICESYSQFQSLTPQLRADFKKWYNLYACESTFGALKALDLPAAFQYSRRAWSKNGGWPIKFIGFVTGRMVEYVQRKISGKRFVGK